MKAEMGRAESLMSMRIVLILLSVGIFTFSAFFVLSAYAPNLRHQETGGPHALSTGATGFAALIKFVDKMVSPATPSRDQWNTAYHEGLVVYTPDEYDDLAYAPEVVPGVGGRLVILPKWDVLPDPAKKGWVQRVKTLPRDIVKFNTSEFQEDYRELRVDRNGLRESYSLYAAPEYGFLLPTERYAIGSIDRLQYFTHHPALTPIILADEGKIIVARLVLPEGYAPYIIVAEPDLLNTLGMADLKRARLAAYLFASLKTDEPVLFDVSLNGFDQSRNVLQYLLSPPLLGTILCFIAITGLMAWHAAFRFGPTIRPLQAHEYGKAALADNAAAMIGLADMTSRFGGRYANYVRQRLRRRFGFPASLSIDEVDRKIRSALGKELAKQYDEAMQSAFSAVTDAEMLKSVRKLHQIRKDATGET